MTVLVVAAHPDDEVLGCGGTIARLARRETVHLLILGEGLSARYPRRSAAPLRGLKRLQAQAHAAARVLGAASLRMEGLPDNRFDTCPLLDIVKRVERVINRVRPDAVYTHHAGDLNIDHAITSRAVLTATRPVPGQPVAAVYAFEVPSSTEWAFGQTGAVFAPNTFVDVSATLETKVKALAQYREEARAFPHPRSPEVLRAAALRWGSVVGLRAAEAFQLVRAVR